MNKTIIFISGWQVPNILARTKYVWDEELWSDYNACYFMSKTPTSDKMIAEHLDILENIVHNNPGCAVVGQSLGAWWAANLALRPTVTIKKLALWTPVCDASAYPVFKASRKFHPPYQKLTNTKGPHRVLTLVAKNDLIVPPDAHGNELRDHFNSMNYELKGGHFFQRNHKAALLFLKDWIETQ